jgi:cytochrome b subunit of formate dehydrogenase
MELFRYATSVYGQDQLLGANWELIWWFGGAGLAYIVADALCRPFLKGAGAKSAAGATSDGSRVTRHHLIDRLYHWAMAFSVLTLMTTSFAPILDWKFEWVTPHWIAGVTLSVLVVYHIIRAAFWQDIWAMIVTPADFRVAFAKAGAAFGRSTGVVPKPGKYVLLQKAYHWMVAGLVLCLMASGLFMWRKIDTPFWNRDPYMLDDETWGYLYTLHDFCAMAVLALVMIHIYFAIRPDKWWLNRSMISGSISRKDYLAHHDPARWTADDA